MSNKKTKNVYICSPLRGDVDKNTKKARDYCRVAIEFGFIPIAPHVLYQGIFNDEIPHERETALQVGLQILVLCDEIWVFGDFVSEGMRGEIEKARELGIPVKYIKSVG